MVAARISVLLIASAVFGVHALKPRCHIKGWGGDIDGKYTFAKEYRESVGMKNAKGMKFYLAGEYSYETIMSSYWVLSDSWGATQEDSDFWSSNYLGVYADAMDQSLTAWARIDVDAKIKCTLHSSLKKVNMLESSPTSFMAWAFMHDNGLETDDDDSDGTKCKSKSTWKKQKCINKCDDASKCANKCKNKCKKCECNEKRLRLV